MLANGARKVIVCWPWIVIPATGSLQMPALTAAAAGLYGALHWLQDCMVHSTGCSWAAPGCHQWETALWWGLDSTDSFRQRSSTRHPQTPDRLSDYFSEVWI